MGLPAESLPPVVELRPSFELEAELMEKYHGPVAGVDEAGRGPWAGPVVAACVILNPNRIPEGLNDSKQLTPNERDERYAEIVATAKFGVAIGTVRRIDRMNILQADLWAMEIPRAGVIAKPCPGAENIAEFGSGKRCNIRPAAQEQAIARQHSLDRGLLQHDFAEPDFVRVRYLARISAPRQIPPFVVVPAKQSAGN